MSITRESELAGMKKAAEAVALTLREMQRYVRPGMSTLELDQYGGALLRSFGANPAPKKAYGFPGNTCISLNQEIAHGIPSAGKVIREGDLLNIDVSAELDGFWADNGGSVVVGRGSETHRQLVETSRQVLKKAIYSIRSGVRISDIGHLIESEAKANGYRVIRNLTGHGIGRALHEAPVEIANFKDRFNRERFQKNSVVAIETFISTQSTLALTMSDGWTLVGNKGGFVAQHEHTIVVTDNEPLILTEMNGIWN